MTEGDRISATPSAAPTDFINKTDGFVQAELAEEEHEFDAISALVLNITIIFCLLLAYFVKRYQIYYLPESAGALLVGIIIGGIARLSTDNLQLFEFVSVQQPWSIEQERIECATMNVYTFVLRFRRIRHASPASESLF